jgi:hypothetical protein
MTCKYDQLQQKMEALAMHLKKQGWTFIRQNGAFKLVEMTKG